MTSLPQFQTSYTVHSGDISEAVYGDVVNAGHVAWDVETTGLDWVSDRVTLCQLYCESGPVALIRVGARPPARLMKLLGDDSIQKVFHHAMFDLRFMANQWGVRPRNIACTKIASKLLFPEQPEAQRLQALVQRYLAITIDKSEQTSNWNAPAYSPSQIRYAITDVVYLFDLLDALLRELNNVGRRTLAEHCFAHIPTRVDLELGGFGDIFIY